MKKSHLLLILPYAVVFAGMIMNQAAVHANGHLMPVLLPGHADSSFTGEDLNHTVMTHATHLKFLCDWIIGNGGVSSLGDYLLQLGSDIKVPSFIAWGALLARDVFVKRG